MASLKYYSTPGKGDFSRDNHHYSEAVRVGDRLELAGQGGSDAHGSFPPDLPSQIANSFASISNVIKHALADSEPNLENGWDKVFRVTSYHVDLKGTDKELLELIVTEMKKWCPNHCPVWTLVGVERLALESMRVEIEELVKAKDRRFQEKNAFRFCGGGVSSHLQI